MHLNHQGSVIALSDSGGNVTTRNTYDEYGIPATTNKGRFGYTGQLYLAELGLYHYKARIYAPESGRFLQTDPIGYADGMNIHAYVGNDPVNKIDPMGTCQKDSNGNAVGVCGSDSVAAKLVSSAINDKNSGVSGVDGLAASQGKMVEITVDDVAVSGKKVNGATTENITLSDGSNALIVTIDTTDTVVMKGHDAVTGNKVRSYEASDAEVLEHELVGHAADALSGVDRGRKADEQNAMDKENLYREKSGNSFRRDKYEVDIKRRK